MDSVSHEGNPLTVGLQDPRRPSLGHLAAGAEPGDPGPVEGVEGLQQRSYPEVPDMVVGQADRIEARRLQPGQRHPRIGIEGIPTLEGRAVT